MRREEERGMGRVDIHKSSLLVCFLCFYLLYMENESLGHLCLM